MNDNIIIMVGFDNICRLCLRSKGAMSDIFATYGEKSLQKQILCITGLTTEENDGLPSKICHRCRHIVEEACELREVVNNSCKILAKTLENSGKCTDNIESVNQDNIEEEGGIIIQECFVSQETIDMTQESDSEKENDVTENVEESILTYTDVMPVPIPKNQGGKRPPPSLVCQLCLDQFATEEDVRIHAEAHYAGSDLQIYLDITKRPFICTVCDEVQLNKPQLVRHHRRHLAVNPYACKETGCTYVGKDRDGIRHHRVIHSAPSHSCSACGARFRRRVELTQHVRRRHARAERIGCASCGLRAASESALLRHMRAHHYAPRYPCPYGSCSMAYRSRRALRDHERAHRGERRYRCPLCNRPDYTSTSSLKRHMKMHDHNLLAQCAQCPAAFTERAALCRHRAAHHADHQCRACAHRYNSELELEEHETVCEELKHLLENQPEQQSAQTDTQEHLLMEEPVEYLEPVHEKLKNGSEYYLRSRHNGRLRKKVSPMSREVLYFEMQQEE